MYLKNIKVKTFRNIENINLELNPNINVFIGDNAQGKTSILESIYVLALTKSMRSGENQELIKIDSLVSSISGTAKIRNVKKNFEVIINKDKKKLKINNYEINRLSDYISNLNVIIFSPDDLDIIKKNPQNRRNLMNIELCQLFPKYLRLLNEYNKILKIRNEYFKSNYNKINFDYLDILTDNLIDRAIVIMDYRAKFIDNINANIDNIYYRIMKEHGLKVNYLKSVNYLDKDSMKKFYKDNYDNEIYKRMTLYGPHRDDLEFCLNGNNLKNFGSQGQQRVTILAFKLSEIQLFKEKMGCYPIVLLDDIFSEIDISKRNNLLKFIKSNIQFIITTTDIKNINKRILDRASIFLVKNGKVFDGGCYEKKV